MKDFRLLYAAVLCLILLSAVTVSAAASETEIQDISNLPQSVPYTEFISDEEIEYYLSLSDNGLLIFHSRTCSACKKVIPLIQEASAKYPDVAVIYFDTYDSNANRTLLTKAGEKYGVKYPSYPVIFAGKKTVLQGEKRIVENYEKLFEAVSSGKIPDETYEELFSASVINSSMQTVQSGSELTLLLVIGAGLADGINPCAFAVLVLLLAAVVSMHSRRHALTAGMIYIIAVYSVYVLAGLGILSFVEFTGLALWFSVFAGICAICAGIIEIADGLFEKFPLSLSIPESRKGYIVSALKSASLPSALILGIFVALIELPCTGGIYLAVLSLLSSQMTFMQGLPYLLIYNAAFVFPLVIIVLVSAYGIPPETLNRIRLERRRVLRVFIGIILIAAGLAALLINL